MEINEYQRMSNVAVQRHDSEKDAMAHWLLGLTEEAGEVSGLIKHKYFHNEPISVLSIAEELGDVLWYVGVICTTLGISLDDVAKANVAKLDIRFDREYDDNKVIDRHKKDMIVRQVYEDIFINRKKEVR